MIHTTVPVNSISDVGRESHIETVYLEGKTDLAADILMIHIWKFYYAIKINSIFLWNGRSSDNHDSIVHVFRSNERHGRIEGVVMEPVITQECEACIDDLIDAGSKERANILVERWKKWSWNFNRINSILVGFVASFLLVVLIVVGERPSEGNHDNVKLRL